MARPSLSVKVTPTEPPGPERSTPQSARVLVGDLRRTGSFDSYEIAPRSPVVGRAIKKSGTGLSAWSLAGGEHDLDSPQTYWLDLMLRLYAPRNRAVSIVVVGFFEVLMLGCIVLDFAFPPEPGEGDLAAGGQGGAGETAAKYATSVSAALLWFAGIFVEWNTLRGRGPTDLNIALSGTALSRKDRLRVKQYDRLGAFIVVFVGLLVASNAIIVSDDAADSTMVWRLMPWGQLVLAPAVFFIVPLLVLVPTVSTVTSVVMRMHIRQFSRDVTAGHIGWHWDIPKFVLNKYDTPHIVLDGLRHAFVIRVSGALADLDACLEHWIGPFMTIMSTGVVGFTLAALHSQRFLEAFGPSSLIAWLLISAMMFAGARVNQEVHYLARKLACVEAEDLYDKAKVYMAQYRHARSPGGASETVEDALESVKATAVNGDVDSSSDDEEGKVGTATEHSTAVNLDSGTDGSEKKPDRFTYRLPSSDILSDSSVAGRYGRQASHDSSGRPMPRRSLRSATTPRRHRGPASVNTSSTGAGWLHEERVLAVEAALWDAEASIRAAQSDTGMRVMGVVVTYSRLNSVFSLLVSLFLLWWRGGL